MAGSLPVLQCCCTRRLRNSLHSARRRAGAMNRCKEALLHSALPARAEADSRSNYEVGFFSGKPGVPPTVRRLRRVARTRRAEAAKRP